MKTIKSLVTKFKNRRVIVGINDNTVYIRFKRLINKSRIKEFKDNPTATMKINRNIVTTDLCISREAALSLAYSIIKELNK